MQDSAKHARFVVLSRAGRVVLFVPHGYSLDAASSSPDTFYIHSFLILSKIAFDLREGEFADS